MINEVLFFGKDMMGGGVGEGEGDKLDDRRLLTTEERLAVGLDRFGTCFSPSLSRVRRLLSLRSDKEEAVI